MKYSRGTLSDFIEFNPRESLPKGNVAKEIAMADLIPFQKKISNYNISPYKGGMKFRNGDTLLARITPCLENGKTAYVDILNEDEVGFGSTEYIVLRAIPQKTIPEFVFYFAISDWFRKRAIALMTGSSGRQRVQTDKLMDLEVIMPDLETQKKIVRSLSALDKKIELNNQQNETLFELGRLLYVEKFENNEAIDKVELKHFFPVVTGKKDANVSSEKGKYPFFTCSKAISRIDDYVFDADAILLAGNGDFNVKFYRGKFDAYQRTYVLIPNNPEYLGFLYWAISCNLPKLTANYRGSVIKFITKGNIESFKVPFVENEFILIFMKYLEKIEKNNRENETLVKMRDALLPKLISGEIKLDKINKK